MSEKFTYQLAPEGGRVKSAGLPFDFITNLGDRYVAYPGPETAIEISNTFSSLRKNPPTPFRNRFFPLGRDEIKGLTRSTPALLRPVFKTDQGPGMFLPFQISSETQALGPYLVQGERGYMITEEYYQNALTQAGNPSNVIATMEELRKHFADGELGQAQLAFERLEGMSDNLGLPFRRRAGVGRYALFFIHPGQLTEPAFIPKDIASYVASRAIDAFGRLEERAAYLKRQFATQNNLRLEKGIGDSLPVYFQVDAQLLPNGDISIAELQIPDVGMFLACLEDYGNDKMKEVSQIVTPMKERVLNGFSSIVKESNNGGKPIFLVTRTSVVEDEEDTLEIKELEEVRDGLQKRGYAAKVISAASAAEIDDDALFFLFNLDPQSAEFQSLALANLRNKKAMMIPDPFLIAAASEITDYPETVLQGRNLENFINLCEPGETNPTKRHTLLEALDGFFRRNGIDEDVLHVCHPQLSTPLPIYRYDLRGMQIVAEIIQKKGLDKVAVRSIPISTDRSIVQTSEGSPYYSTFRFMMHKNIS